MGQPSIGLGGLSSSTRFGGPIGFSSGPIGFSSRPIGFSSNPSGFLDSNSIFGARAKRQAAFGGRECVGQPTQVVTCNLRPCPVDCQVSDYECGECSAACGEGTKTCRRTVTVQPQHGGRQCPQLERTESCNSDPDGGVEFFDMTGNGNNALDDQCEAVCPEGRTCEMINVDFGVVDREKNLKIFCTTCREKFRERNTAFYEGDGLEQLILTTRQGEGYRSLHATFSMPGNGTYSIENCGPERHVFIDHTGWDKVEEPAYDYSNVLEDEELGPELRAKLDRGKEDRNTNATVSIIFYYTDMFEAETPDIEGHIDDLVETTNVAFLNSDMPVRVEMHCMLKVPYPEDPSKTSKERLDEWFASQGNDDERLRQSADFAILIMSTKDETDPSRDPIGGEVSKVAPVRNSEEGKFAGGWIAKNYKKAFIHEMGHIFGGRHDKRSLQQSRSAIREDQFEFGFFLRDGQNKSALFAAGGGSQDGGIGAGNYTIMATGDAGDEGDGRTFYFSTPVDIRGRGRNVFGDDDDDNRRKLIEERFLLSENGDESIKQCGFPKDKSILLYPTYLVTRFIPAFFQDEEVISAV